MKNQFFFIASQKKIALNGDEPILFEQNVEDSSFILLTEGSVSMISFFSNSIFFADQHTVNLYIKKWPIQSIVINTLIQLD